MRRSALPILVAVLACLWAASAYAVEVFVKTPTTLYDSNGTVVQDVSAGYPFEADQARGKWVYGFLKTKSGGRRGYIRVDALDLNDDHRRALNIPITTGKSAEPVLLRFKAEPGELQRYEYVMSMRTRKSTRVGRETHAENNVLQGKFGLQLECQGAKKGVYTIEARCDRFDMSADMKSDKFRVQMKANTSHVTIYVDGERKYSGTWDALPGGDAPDLSRLLERRATLQMDERNQLLGGQTLNAAFNPESDASGGDADSAIRGELIYPEKSVRGGDTWDQKIEAEVTSPIERQRTLVLSGTATFTVLERVTYMEQACAKIRVVGRFTAADPGPGTQAVQSLEGIQIVDERTGRQLRATVVCTLNVTEAGQNTATTCTYTEQTDLRYAGNKPR